MRLIKTLDDGEWSRTVGYGRHWTAETAFSTFKQQHSEHYMAKTYIYNTPINLK